MGKTPKVARTVVVAAVVAVLCVAAAGVRMLEPQQQFFWEDGDSWENPARCLACGGDLEPVEEAIRKCTICGITFAVP